jgi:hypothetical protein
LCGSCEFQDEARLVVNLLYSIAHYYVPTFLKKRGLRTLFEATAMAFDRKTPPTERMSYDKCLETYARFTESAVSQTIDDRHDMGEKAFALRHNAFQVGIRFRTLFGVTTRKDVMEVARLLYRIIGIDFHGTTEGEITISRCAFDRFYSARTCRVMSSFDEGVLAGLSGDGNLVFTGRLTDGYPYCEAHFEFKDQSSEKSNSRR